MNTDYILQPEQDYLFCFAGSTQLAGAFLLSSDGENTFQKAFWIRALLTI
jgi:hypothetical protein